MRAPARALRPPCSLPPHRITQTPRPYTTPCTRRADAAAAYEARKEWAARYTQHDLDWVNSLVGDEALGAMGFERVRTLPRRRAAESGLLDEERPPPGLLSL